MTATDTRTVIPGYTAGTWTIDPVHSEVGFTVRHMMVSKVRVSVAVMILHLPDFVECSTTITI